VSRNREVRFTVQRLGHFAGAAQKIQNWSGNWEFVRWIRNCRLPLRCSQQSNFNIAIYANSIVASITRTINNDWVWLGAAFPTRNDFPADECTNKFEESLSTSTGYSKS
jgi:hypothetical protein